jgi:transposase
MIFVGIDWAERHHDVCVIDADGQFLAKGRIVDGLDGVARLHALIGKHAADSNDVVVGVETDRGLLVEALVAGGYQVYAINPFAASRYRDRHVTSGAKSDPGDAKVLADLVRTDRHNHRRVAGDSALAEAIKILARAHQRLIWARQRQLNGLRSALREFYPGALLAFGTDLDTGDAIAVLGRAAIPVAGRRIRLSTLECLLRQGGRQRRVTARAIEIQTALRAPQLEAAPAVTSAYGVVVRTLVQIIGELNKQVATLEAELTTVFEQHADAAIVESLPGLGPVLGARTLAEFGDDPARYSDAKARKAYAGTAPITRASGTRHTVLARVARNRHLVNACFRWAYASLRGSLGARSYYDAHRARGQTHNQALRALANRLVGILHGCLAHRTLYREDLAWRCPQQLPG